MIEHESDNGIDKKDSDDNNDTPSILPDYLDDIRNNGLVFINLATEADKYYDQRQEII